MNKYVVIKKIDGEVCDPVVITNDEQLEMESLKFCLALADRLIPSLYKEKRNFIRFLHEKKLAPEYIRWLKERRKADE